MSGKLMKHIWIRKLGRDYYATTDIFWTIVYLKVSGPKCVQKSKYQRTKLVKYDEMGMKKQVKNNISLSGLKVTNIKTTVDTYSLFANPGNYFSPFPETAKIELMLSIN